MRRVMGPAGARGILVCRMAKRGVMRETNHQVPRGPCEIRTWFGKPRFANQGHVSGIGRGNGATSQMAGGVEPERDGACLQGEPLGGVARFPIV